MFQTYPEHVRKLQKCIDRCEKPYNQLMSNCSGSVFSGPGYGLRTGRSGGEPRLLPVLKRSRTIKATAITIRNESGWLYVCFLRCLILYGLVWLWDLGLLTADSIPMVNCSFYLLAWPWGQQYCLWETWCGKKSCAFYVFQAWFLEIRECKPNVLYEQGKMFGMPKPCGMIVFLTKTYELHL